MPKPTYKIKGSHPYEAGINLFDLCKLMYLKSIYTPSEWEQRRSSTSPIIELKPQPETESLKVTFEVGRSRAEYTFHPDSFDYEMHDVDGQTLDNPKKAKKWTLENALDWIHEAAIREERPIAEEDLPQDLEWFLGKFAEIKHRPPTPEEVETAYGMLPLRSYKRGITLKQAKEALKRLAVEPGGREGEEE